MEIDRHEEEDTQKRELIALLKRFSSITVGTLLKTRQEYTKLPITFQDTETATLFAPIKFTFLPKDTSLFLFDIEVGKVGQHAENAAYAARFAGLAQDDDFASYCDSIYGGYSTVDGIEDRLRRQILNTVAFHFLTSENDRLIKCHFVLHNKTIASIRLFFSLFDIAEPGLTENKTRPYPVEREQDGQPKS